MSFLASRSRILQQTVRVQRTGLCQSATQRRCFRASPARLEQFFNADEQTFAKAISKEREDRLVLVDFYADWCGPCKMLSPVLEKLSSDPKLISGSGCGVDLVTVDIDAHPEIAAKYKVSSIPAVFAFRDGQLAGKFVGAVPEPEVRKFVDNM